MPNPTAGTYVRVKQGSECKEIGPGGNMRKTATKPIFTRVAKLKSNIFEEKNHPTMVYPVTEQDVPLEIDHWTDRDNLEIVQVPSITKEEQSHVLRGSEWTVDEDMFMFFGLLRTVGKNKYLLPVDREVKAGTVFKVVSPKFKKEYDLYKELCMMAKWDDQTFMVPLRFIGGMTCTKEGKKPTYWKLFDKNGVLVRPKKYKHLGSLKSGIRLITGMQKTGWSEETQWVEDTVLGGDKFDEWVAVEYNSDGEELQRVDLSEWYIQTILMS